MKRVIGANNQIKLKFDIEYIVEIVYPEGNENKQIAAVSYKGIEIPDGELLPAEKDVLIDSQVLADYHSFIECIEDLIIDVYELEIYYRNDSPYNSFYFGVLAKNSDETIILDFDLTLRVSTHDAHRTKESQHYKKEKKAALKKIAHTKKPTPITYSVIVNREEFDNYLDAFVAIDDKIKHAVEMMERR